MRKIAAPTMLAIVLLFPGSPRAAQAPRQPHLGRETWYEAMLKKLNGSQKNYGEWVEERRQALLAASVQNPFFWYAFSMTVCASLFALALLNGVIRSREASREHARIEADIRNHDLHSRERAREAVEKYNRHIEECNRATEASESGSGRPDSGHSAVESLRAELQRVAAELEATTQERNKLQDEVRQKSLVVADLSTRLDGFSKKGNGPRDTGGGSASSVCNGDSATVIGQINRLQEELYAERQKNKRLKGG